MPAGEHDRLVVAVCGPNDTGAEELAWAEAVGRGLAEAGAVLLCGGLGGVMEAASKGATDAGGLAVGILPGNDRRGANPFLSLALPTGLGETRNTVLVRMADVVIAISGEYGTLSEVAFALKVGVPVIGLNTWELSKSGGPPVDAIERASDPEDAVRRAVALGPR